MHDEIRIRETLYSNYVLKYIRYAQEIGETVMTIGQFANFARISKSHNLRKRLKQLHTAGVIQLRQDYVAFGTLQHIIVFNVPQQYELPF